MVTGVMSQLVNQTVSRWKDRVTFPYHAWDWYIYLHYPTFIIKNQPNVGKYTIHGWYGIPLCLLEVQQFAPEKSYE